MYLNMFCIIDKILIKTWRELLRNRIRRNTADKTL
jgi:hypothetical protein